MISRATTTLLCTAVMFTSTAVAAEPASDTIPTADGELVVHPINHATFVIEWNGRTVVVDPVGGAEPFAAYHAPDLILITHIHGDHTSVETVAAVATDGTVTVAPTSVAEKLGTAIPGQLTILANGETTDRDGIGIEAIPAYNLTDDRLEFHPPKRGDNGYVLTLGGVRLYISGDTEDIPEMRSLEDIDAAFVCMNLPYTMTVERAADAVLAFAPRIVYPYHYRGTGGLSDLDRFSELVAADPEIEVRRLSWY